MKILIADKLSPVGIDWLAEQEDVEIDVKPGLSPEELAQTVGEDDGMIIRPSELKAAELVTYHDHRVVMSLTVAALAARGKSLRAVPGELGGRSD